MHDSTAAIDPTERGQDPLPAGPATTEAMTAAGAGLGLGQAAPTPSGSGRFAGKVALVTGAAQGIGRQIAEQFAEQGADVAICDLAQQIPSVPYPMGSPEKLDEARHQIQALGRRCFAQIADVRNLAELREFVEGTLRELGRLDYVIANAGIATYKNLEETDDASWHDVIDVNVTGTANTLRAVIPHLKTAQGARIVTLSSVAGEGGNGHTVAYAASKWAILGLTKCAAVEFGQYGVTVNAVCPTVIRTPMGMNQPNYQTILDVTRDVTTEEFDTHLKDHAHALPVGMLDAKAIADAVLFLCSDEAQHISGMPLDVQAGRNAQNLT